MNEKINEDNIPDLEPKKKVEFYVCFAETMKNVYESDFPEGKVPHRLVLRRYIATVPNNEKFQHYWLVRSPKSHRIMIQIHNLGACKRLSIVNKEFVREDKRFKRVFDDVHELNQFMRNHPRIAHKLFKDVHSIRGGKIGVSVYNIKLG